MLTINNTEIFDRYLDIDLFENMIPKITVEIENDTPKICINIKLIGRISGIKDGIDYSDEPSNLDLEKIPQEFKLGIFLIIFLAFFGTIFYYLKGLNKKLGANSKKKKKKTQ